MPPLDMMSGLLFTPAGLRLCPRSAWWGVTLLEFRANGGIVGHSQSVSSYLAVSPKLGSYLPCTWEGREGTVIPHWGCIIKLTIRRPSLRTPGVCACSPTTLASPSRLHLLTPRYPPKAIHLLLLAVLFPASHRIGT